MFSHRTDWSFTSNPLMVQLNALKEKKVPIFDLTESNPTRAGICYPKEKILTPLRDAQNLLYRPEPFGDMKARQAICAMYKRQGIFIEPVQIVLTSSSSEAYSFLFRLLLNPKEAVLFPRPSYPLFDFLAQLNDVVMESYPLAYYDVWELSEEKLKAAIHENTKAVVVVNPNNPTGSFVKEDELTRLNHICRKHKLVLISDEVFWDYRFEDEKKDAKSLVDNKPVLTFTLGGLSKSLGLPQMKLSWIVVSGPQNRVEDALKRLEIIADTYLSVNTPSQNALSDWFLQKEKIQKQIKARIEKNKSVLLKALSETSLSLLRAEGGWYGIIRLCDTETEEKWAMDLLEHHHVFVHPGYFFDLEEGAHLVVSYLTPVDIFEEGIKRIVGYDA